MKREEAEQILRIMEDRERHFESESKFKDGKGMYLEAAGFKMQRDGVFCARSYLWKHFNSMGIRLKFVDKV